MSGNDGTSGQVVHLLRAILDLIEGERNVPSARVRAGEPLAEVAERVLDAVRGESVIPDVPHGKKTQVNVNLDPGLARWLRAASKYYVIPQNALVERGLRAVRTVVEEELGPVPAGLLEPPPRWSEDDRS